MKWMIDPEIQDRVDQLDIGFNRYGIDKFGVSKKHVSLFLSLLSKFYRSYFKVSAQGLERIPDQGRVMIVGNHSGGVAIDGAMVIASLLLDKDPPRLAQGMVEKFMNNLPFSSAWNSRAGQLTGLPEHAVQLLNDERVLLVFPEGARGTAKLYKERYSLVRFGTGFMRLALQNNTPIVPFAFLGGGDILPTIMNLKTLGKLVGAPYIPITPYLLPIPLPRPCQILYGEPMHFEGDGYEDDDMIEMYVAEVKAKIADLIQAGREQRHLLDDQNQTA
ncbi:MAG: acyltransferase family protein [Deltaproteobacteria bacterium]|nr:MAG: acyltransferase family protein [Deltaproteobacteria bacterium]